MWMFAGYTAASVASSHHRAAGRVFAGNTAKPPASSATPAATFTGPFHRSSGGGTIAS